MEDDRIQELGELDRDHFWFRAKQKYLSLLIGTGEAAILDVGCGAGGNMARFIAEGHRVFGVDRSDRAVAACNRIGYTAFRADLETDEIAGKCPPLDYITAMDFLEHVRGPEAVLRKLRSVAAPHTQLIVTVPSYPCLFSDWDRAMGHVRRYRTRTLRQVLTRGGWHVLRSTYIHALPLLPAFLARKLLKGLTRRGPRKKTDGGQAFYRPPGMLNAMLYHLYHAEFLCFRMGLPVPLGLSVLAVARPQQEAHAS